MCTAVSYNANNHYFGRNLDLEGSFNEQITITPRNYTFSFKYAGTLEHHYAIIGMAYVKDNYPLYYDGVNEKGLAIAGLNFPVNARYNKPAINKTNLASYEFLPWILSSCGSISEAKEALCNINLTDDPFPHMPLTPLHWIISDKHSSVVAEPTENGLVIYDNPVGVLTNNPTFDKQLFNLSSYVGLSSQEPDNCFSRSLKLPLYSRGMGSIGLPGDFSSPSRFVRAAFVKENSPQEGNEQENVNQFFHILNSVYHPKGSVRLHNDKCEITIYSSCMNTEKGIYYYTTYNNCTIIGIDINREDIERRDLIIYPLIKNKGFVIQN